MEDPEDYLIISRLDHDQCRHALHQVGALFRHKKRRLFDLFLDYKRII